MVIVVTRALDTLLIVNFLLGVVPQNTPNTTLFTILQKNCQNDFLIKNRQASCIIKTINAFNRYYPKPKLRSV